MKFAEPNSKLNRIQKMTSAKPFKRTNQLYILYKKREPRNTHDPHQITTTTAHQISELGQLQKKKIISGFKRSQLHPYRKQ